MSLQYKSLAIVVGAQGDEIARVAEMLKENQAQMQLWQNRFSIKLEKHISD